MRTEQKGEDARSHGAWKTLAAVIVILCIGVLFGYFSRALQEILTPVDLSHASTGGEQYGGFKNETERQEFKRLLKKHGLEHHVSVVYHDHLGRYYIRDGKRCAFQ